MSSEEFRQNLEKNSLTNLELLVAKALEKISEEGYSNLELVKNLASKEVIIYFKHEDKKPAIIICRFDIYRQAWSQEDIEETIKKRVKFLKEQVITLGKN